MDVINKSVMDRLGAQSQEFRHTQPYPWIRISDFLYPEKFDQLCKDLPDPVLFESQMGYKRAHGQASHDRLALQYRPALEKVLTPSWRDFIHELHSEAYQDFWREMLGLTPRTPVILTMHWHYAPSGASISPHTDARRKIGSHIFYFNTPEDWEEAWGGQTLVLDDGGKWPRHSAPVYTDLREAGASQVLGNRSFLFAQTDHSWHAVKAVQCPPGHFRKVFIVVANRLTPQVIWRRVRGKDADGYRLAGGVQEKNKQ
ncbi:2OG-Fe(II) oxygenase [Acidithiobacillus albertensis]|uniref:2OG-Fe(II) oxygenase n=1 Tax=Acidithiobacillus albertensis TaxID=119978 RepID=UPI00094AAE29|nr:2OG-Fe(II) oxygenase [Acidithiobacillus albertensis]